MLEQIRQSIEQAQMVLVGIGTEFAVKEEAQEDPFFTELAKTAQTDPAAAALLAFHKSQKKVGGCEKEQVQKAYEVLADLLKDKNYFVISLCEDGLLEQAGLKENRILTPAKEGEEETDSGVSDRQLGNLHQMATGDIKQKFGDSGAGRWDGAAAADPFSV